jgi:hypothetical protein
MQPFLDIDLQAHKDWEDKVCYASGLKAILPLGSKIALLW